MKYKRAKKRISQKRTNRKGLIKELDRVFSLFIRERDGECVTCHKKRDLTCSHLFSRVAHSTRWDEVNCHCQCRGCNMYHEHNPHIFTNWFIHKFGVDKYDWLLAKHKKTAKYPDFELLHMIESYRDKLVWEKRYYEDDTN